MIAERRDRWALTLCAFVVIAAAAGVWWWSVRPTPGRESRDAESGAGVDADTRSGRFARIDTGPMQHADTVAAEESLDEIVIDIEGFPALPDVRLHGTVADSSGQPLDGYIHFEEEWGRTSSGGIQEDGRFETTAFPGKWTWTADFDNSRKAEGSFLIPEGAEEHRLDIVLEPRVLIDVFVVTPGGRSVPEALSELGFHRLKFILAAVATVGDPGPRLPRTEEFDSRQIGAGRFEKAQYWDTDRGRIGRIELEHSRSVFVSVVLREIVLASTPVPAGAREVTLVVSMEDIRAALGSVRVRVVDAESGALLPDASVLLLDRDESRARRIEPAPGGPEGVFLRESLSPGYWCLGVESKRYESASRWVRIEAGEVNDLGDWQLRREVSVSGYFYDPAGRPAWLTFQVLDIDACGPDVPWHTAPRNNVPDGSFRLDPRVGSGRYAIRPMSSEWAWEPVEIDTRYGPVEDLRIDLREGTPVRIRGELGELEACLVQLRTDRGLPVLSRFVGGGDSIVVPLAPGTYTLAVVDAEGKRTTRSVEVGTSPVTVPIREGGE